MNKGELIDQVAVALGRTKKETEKILGALFACVEEALQSGDNVQLVGFRTFEVRERQPRKGRNPQTGELIDIPGGRVPAFKAGKAFKDAVK